MKSWVTVILVLVVLLVITPSCTQRIHPTTGSLRFETSPSGGEVWMDGGEEGHRTLEMKGTTPLTINNLPDGNVYVYNLTLTGYHNRGLWRVGVQAGKTTTISHTFVPLQ